MSEDLISRQAAIEHLKKRLYETALNNITEHPYYEEMADNRVDVWLNELPSVERHGRWKPFDLTWGRSIYACTACGDAFEVPTECGKPMYEFCPHCGAKMSLGEE